MWYVTAPPPPKKKVHYYFLCDILSKLVDIEHFASKIMSSGEAIW
jgi:hypothetical protein